jgi:hypothetical protein
VTRDKNSKDCRLRIGVAEESATVVVSIKCAPSTSSSIEPDLCFLKLDTYFQKFWAVTSNCYQELKVSKGVYSIPVRQRRCELPVKAGGLEVF